MTQVYERKRVMIQWHPVLGTTADSAFTMPSGERLVYIVPNSGIFPGSWNVIAFHPLTPFYDAFNAHLYTFREAKLGETLIDKS